MLYRPSNRIHVSAWEKGDARMIRRFRLGSHLHDTVIHERPGIDTGTFVWMIIGLSLLPLMALALNLAERS